MRPSSSVTTADAATAKLFGACDGLLRQYFPKGTDLAVHTRERLYAVNSRSRKTLGWETPAERLHKLLAV
ncbi:hypothetical protein GCM10010251_05760 [Streptomyces aurantiogriseus]|uniref:Transposase n=1 Tax=Streptomyces aurantiogriseus TaxID=66870 RepID=A0A918F1V3_9ACTN|nr:hypothetical protein GCM10010251_05760 [Streptomyces aurantiogriseus]